MDRAPSTGSTTILAAAATAATATTASSSDASKTDAGSFEIFTDVDELVERVEAVHKLFLPRVVFNCGHAFPCVPLRECLRVKSDEDPNAQLGPRYSTVRRLVRRCIDAANCLHLGADVNVAAKLPLHVYACSPADAAASLRIALGDLASQGSVGGGDATNRHSTKVVAIRAQDVPRPREFVMLREIALRATAAAVYDWDHLTSARARCVRPGHAAATAIWAATCASTLMGPAGSPASSLLYLGVGEVFSVDDWSIFLTREMVAAIVAPTKLVDMERRAGQSMRFSVDVQVCQGNVWSRDVLVAPQSCRPFDVSGGQGGRPLQIELGQLTADDFDEAVSRGTPPPATETHSALAAWVLTELRRVVRTIRHADGRFVRLPTCVTI